MLKTQNLQNDENYTNYWNHVNLPLGRVQAGEKKEVYSGSEKKIHHCEVFLYVVLVEWIHLTDLHNFVVLLAQLELARSMLKTQKFTKS